MNNSIYAILKNSSTKYGEITALSIRRMFRIEKYSYSDLYSLSLKVGTYLIKNGVKRGDRIITWGFNMPEYNILFWGTLIYGAVLVPVNISASEETTLKYIRATNAKLLVRSMFVSVKNPGIKTVIMEEFVELIKRENETKPKNLHLNNLAEIVFTSGTTGEPKGVMISHKNMLAEYEMLMRRIPAYKRYSVLSVLPISHVYEQMMGILCPAGKGATIYYLQRLNPVTISKALIRKKITHLALVPQILQLIMDRIELQAKVEGKEKGLLILRKISRILPLSLRRLVFKPILNKLGGQILEISSSGAPLDKKLAEKWELMGIKIVEGYGTSETSGGICSNTVNMRVLGSVGTLFDGIKMKLSQDDEILIKGENVSMGYFNNKKETDAVFDREGYYHTGDVGRIDNNGYIWITGRKKFKIVTAAGDKVYPEDVERKLNNLKEVKQSCVFGIDTDQGEEVHASILPQDRETFNSDRLLRHINSQLETHQQIKSLSVWQKDVFPQTPTLKIDRQAVKDELTKKTVNTTSENKPLSDNKLVRILALVSKVKEENIADRTTMGKDLKIDSLKRAAIAALVEEEFGVVIVETEINAETTVKSLRKMIQNGRKIGPVTELSEWQLAKPIVWLRENLIKSVFFPLQKLFVTDIKIEGKENLEKIKTPSIIIFNHVGQFDGMVVVRVLPENIRQRLVTLADSDLFEVKWKLLFMRLLGNAYPLHRWGGAVRDSLELATDLLDKGWNLIMAPEGAISPDGNLMEFKLGAAMLAKETGVPVVPIKIVGYRQIYQHTETPFYLPEGRGRLRVIVGKEIKFEKGITYEAANKLMWKQMSNL